MSYRFDWGPIWEARALILDGLVTTVLLSASALGSLTESDEAVREAAYRHHPDERTEVDEDDG